MIHVCSFARLHDTVAETGAGRVVTLMRDTWMVKRPAGIAEDDHLVLELDDIVEPIDGQTPPGEQHVAQLLDFVRGWDRRTPLVVHCWAGISRSTASAFTAACALVPERDEAAFARAIRDASPTAMPNIRIVAFADRLLGRDGRMIKAVEALGPGVSATEGVPFRLGLE